MQVTLIPCQGVAGLRLMDQMAEALEPIAVAHGGEPIKVLKPMIESAWYELFQTPLREPALSRCAAAIALDHPWQLALWSNEGP